MQVLAVVNLMTFLVIGLLLFVLLTPRDRGRAASRVSRLYLRSDSHRPATSTKQ